jgi:hypothetical protein
LDWGEFVTELGGSQISSLMEVLPGIAQVLRSPVADAIVNLIRAGLRQREFELADAEEMLKYAVRRNLMGQDESDRVLAEAKAVILRRAERAAEREKNAPAKRAPAAVVARPKAKAPPRPKPKAAPPKKSKPAASHHHRPAKAAKPAKKKR